MTVPGEAPVPESELPDSRLKQAWYCEQCGMISESQWLDGSHADRRDAGLNERCEGAASGPYYLVTADVVLDFVESGRPGG